MISLRVRASLPATYEGEAPLDQSEKQWLLYLAQKEIGLDPGERPTLEQLVALAQDRKINLARVFR